MKKILALALLLPSVAFGQGWQIGNPPGTPRALPTPGTSMQKANVDVYGNQLVGLSNGGVASATNAVKLEDSVAASGDALVGVAARVKGDFNASAADLDYAHLNVDLDGRLATNPWGADTSETGSNCATATASTADISLKAATVSTRIYVGSITCKNTSATVATSLDFKDGATVLAVGGVSQMAAGASGSYVASFNPPLRGTVNTAFQFATNVSTSSVTCCISWFTSGN